MATVPCHTSGCKGQAFTPFAPCGTTRVGQTHIYKPFATRSDIGDFPYVRRITGIGEIFLCPFNGHPKRTQPISRIIYRFYSKCAHQYSIALTQFVAKYMRFLVLFSLL